MAVARASVVYCSKILLLSRPRNTDMDKEQTRELEEFFDKQIHAHLAEIRLLREQRNAACSRTKMLPPEILSNIFGILDVTYNLKKVLYPHLRWKAVTHVCRAWRHVALNEPTLWSDFSDVHPRWTHEFLARSKAAPLRLRYYPGLHRPEEHNFLLDTVIKSPERLKHLHIEYEGAFVRNQLTKPFPFLESIELSDASSTLPPDFLGGFAPRLRSAISHGHLNLGASWLANVAQLECRGGRYFFEAGYPSKLTSLYLGLGWCAINASGGTQCITMDFLLSAFEGMPLLERLSFQLPYDVDGRPCSRLAPLHLHRLRDITVGFNHMEEVSAMFDYLRVDNLGKLHVEWPHTKYTTTAIEPLCRFFEACYLPRKQSTLLAEGRFQLAILCRILRL